MPIVTVTLRKPKTLAFKSAVLSSVHAALVGIGVNADDQFQRVLELPEEDFRFHPTFPDLKAPRTADFVLIEILLGVGRSVKVKKLLLADLMQRLTTQGLDPEQVMVCFLDVPWENWSAGGGRVLHA